MGRDPREARRRQTELDILQLADRMRVAVYREEAPLLERQRSELRIQVLPVRVAVEFHGNAQSGSRFEDAAPVGLQARAREHPAARVAQHVDARLLHHPQPSAAANAATRRPARIVAPARPPCSCRARSAGVGMIGDADA
jgi:hypothetical protein